MGIRGQIFRTVNPTTQLHPTVSSRKRAALTIAGEVDRSSLPRLIPIYCKEHGRTHSYTAEEKAGISQNDTD